MPHPLLAMLTADFELFSRIDRKLPGSARLFETAAAIRQLLSEHGTPPVALVFDFRGVTAGGHLEVKLLDDILGSTNHPVLWTLTDSTTPETIERRLLGANVRRHAAPLDELALIAELQSVLPTSVDTAATGNGVPGTFVAATGVAQARSASGGPAAPFVLSGITRQFETSSLPVKQMLADLEVAAGYDVTILLIGETGAGKTFLSRLVHEVSPRRNEPFLHVACGALPADLIESELFGHVKGAFTSAHADKDGKFLAARRGTILLDEIDVLGPEQQVKLLRVIESGEFEPVGSNRTLQSDARLIVASNLDLQPLVEQGRFRPDLYYRLNMLKFDLLPLRERKGDIIPLARKFIAEMSEKHRVQINHIDDSLFLALLRYPWPGNVRELENVIQRAVIYARQNELSSQHLPSHILACEVGPSNDGSTAPQSPSAGPPLHAGKGLLGRQVALSERDIIEQTLFKNNYSRTSTAKALGISRVTLYNKMKKYGMTK